MATGLKLPVGVSPRGGAALISGDTNDQKIIFCALGDCDSLHAFQQELGLGADIIYSVNNPTFRARVFIRLQSIFAVFEEQKRYKLLPDTVVWSEGDGEATIEFRYVNLESDEEVLFRRQFRTD